MLVHPEDVFLVKHLWWPQYSFYDLQIEMIESVLSNRETYAPAANGMGKDFIAGFLPLACALVCEAKGIHFRMINTSVDEDHLKVVWGETSKFIEQAKRPVLSRDGGPFDLNHMELRLASERHLKNPFHYVLGRVSKSGEGLAGHHARFTLGIGDESSGLVDKVYEMFQGWCQHMLFIGNTNPCDNFFKRHSEAGDVPLPSYDDELPSALKVA